MRTQLVTQPATMAEVRYATDNESVLYATYAKLRLRRTFLKLVQANPRVIWDEAMDLLSPAEQKWAREIRNPNTLALAH